MYNTTWPNLFWKIFVDFLTSTLLRAQNTTLLSKVRWRFFSNFVAFSEIPNFTYLSILWILSSIVAEMRNLCTVVGLVWPILWTLPIACNSWAGFKIGSTNSTWLASIKFNPFAPEVIGNNNTLTSSLFWKSSRKNS